MPIFQCRKCTYTTKQRSSILRHLNNKRACRLQLIKVGIDTNFDDLKNHKNEPDGEYDGDTSESSDGSDGFDIASNFTDLTMLDDIFEIIDDKPAEKN